MRHYFDSTGNLVSKEEAVDENGILRNGYGVRAGMFSDGRAAGTIMFLDGADRFTDATAASASARAEMIAGLTGHAGRVAPAWVRDHAPAAPVTVADAAARTTADAARAAMIAELTGKEA